jgi:ABC-type uncharacterized transport system auxiliary subunit
MGLSLAEPAAAARLVVALAFLVCHSLRRESAVAFALALAFLGCHSSRESAIIFSPFNSKTDKKGGRATCVNFLLQAAHATLFTDSESAQLRVFRGTFCALTLGILARRVV